MKTDEESAKEYAECHKIIDELEEEIERIRNILADRDIEWTFTEIK